jgi:hypothetical protein
MGMLFEKGESKSQESCPSQEVEWMETKIHFSSEEYADTFRSLSGAMKNRIAAYVKCDFSCRDAAKLLAVSSASFMKALDRVFKEQFGNPKTKVLSAILRDSRKPNEVATAAELMGLIEQQEFRCAISGAKLTPSNSVLDHIIPVANGGGNGIENLQWVRRNVNTMKATMSQEEFLKICRRIVAWNR